MLWKWLLPEEEFIEKIVLITIYTNSNLVWLLLSHSSKVMQTILLIIILISINNLFSISVECLTSFFFFIDLNQDLTSEKNLLVRFCHFFKALQKYLAQSRPLASFHSLLSFGAVVASPPFCLSLVESVGPDSPRLKSERPPPARARSLSAAPPPLH